MTITPAAALDDPALLAPAFAGKSWDTWRAILKAAYGEKLTRAEFARFKAVAGDRPPPKHRVRELIVIAGRRSGKDSMASAIATVAAIEDYRPQLRLGEKASILCLAVDRDQARIVHRYISGYFNSIPLLQPFLVREDSETIELANQVEIIVATNSYRSVRGRTIACSIFDEASFWRSDDAKNPDVETYHAVLPGMVTLPGSILVIITTAYRKSGLAYSKWHAHYAKPDDDVLVVYGPSTAFNPLLPQKIIDTALERDPEAAGAEWLSIWRSDIGDMFDAELIAAAVDDGVVVRPPSAGISYCAFADPSGGRGDAFTVAVSHLEGERVIVDCLFEKRAPFDPIAVVAEIAELLRQYGVSELVHDRYAASWVTESCARVGLRSVQSDRDRSAIYLDSLPLFTSGRLRLPDNARLAHQLTSLERRTSRLGKDRVDHPPGGSDDLANAACGAAVTAVARQIAPALFRPGDLQTPSGAAIPWPVRCQQVFASVGVDLQGPFTCYWAAGAERYPYEPGLHPPRHLLLDYERQPLAPHFFFQLAARLQLFGKDVLNQLASENKRQDVYADIAILPSSLLPYALGAGLRPIDGDPLLAPATRPHLTYAAAAAIGGGNCKIAVPAEATSRHLPLPFIGLTTDSQPTAAADSALLGIASHLPREMWPQGWQGI